MGKVIIIEKKDLKITAKQHENILKKDKLAKSMLEELNKNIEKLKQEMKKEE